MQARIAPAHLAVLARALQCLCRVSGSVVLELSTSGALQWRALNDSQTAFAALRLNPSFFDGPVQSPASPCRCRLPSRNLIWALRPRLLTSKAGVQIGLDPDGLLFALQDDPGSLGQRIRIGSDDIRGSVYSHSCDKGSASSCVVLNSRWLQKQLEAFHPLLKEITIQALADSMIVRSFVEGDDHDDPAALDTEVRLRADDFEQYSVADDAASSMAFALKDLKSMLRFCEAAETNLYLFFSGAGRPLIMSSAGIDDLNNPWTLNMVVATFNADDDADDVVESQHDSQISNPRTILRQDDGRPAAKRRTSSEPLSDNDDDASVSDAL